MSQTNLMMLILRLQRRTEVFSEVLQTGLVTSVNVDTNQSDKLLRLLDTVVIKLEGGTDEDLKVLDEKPNEYRSEVAKEPVLTPAATAAAATTKDAAPTATEPKTDGNEANDGMDEDGAVKEVDAITPNDVSSGDKPAKSEEKASKKRKRTTSGSSSSSSSSTSSSGLYFLYKKFHFFKERVRERERRNKFLFASNR